MGHADLSRRRAAGSTPADAPHFHPRQFATVLETAAQLLRAYDHAHGPARRTAGGPVDLHTLADEFERWFGPGTDADADAEADAEASVETPPEVALRTPADSASTAVAPRVAAQPAPAGSVESDAPARGAAPSMEVYLLSPFKVFANDHPIEDWANGKSRSIFKYLVLHRAQPVAKEVLMDVFWPGADADAARNNLNVAIYGLRKALEAADPDFAFVRFRQGCYSFNPALRLWVDVEAFTDHLHAGQAAEQHAELAQAMNEYRVAQAIYQAPLLVDDRYEDWLIPHRQGLQDRFQHLLARLARHEFEQQHFEACTGVGLRMLEIDRCDEAAHRLLMRCYSRMGQAHLALRQYHFCVDALARELDLIPSPQTVALFQQIRRRQTV